MLMYLSSGRIALVYNPLYPQNITEFEKAECPRRTGQFFEVAASWMREDLAVRFSDDECDSWSESAVIAQCSDAWLAYPMVYEVELGRVSERAKNRVVGG